MGDLSAHFSKSEFACHCGCGSNAIDDGVVFALERIRSAIGDKPIKILSGIRCAKHNKACGGVKNSQHLLGKAADIRTNDLTPSQLAKLIEENIIIGGIGIYPTFVHIDIRQGHALWRG
ncbi:MAG: D-Ala-D-Ala carboxypeptidase family metallohydrolase [Methylococcales bacterium]|nr:D-Ala-D-Ala carboxypeptidase family metallohydrolase [Methylococcales bacterium]